MTIIKRNGNIVDFDRDKIVKAINKAFVEVDGKLYETDTANGIADEIALLNKEKLLGVEEIQDLVEDYLMRSERRDVARAYIRFRYKKEMSRKAKKEWYTSISDKLMAKNVKNQNANVDEHSFGGRVGEASDLVMRQFALDNCISKMARDNHLNNQIYIHDLSAYAVGNHNCLSIPFDKLLAEGFNTRQTDVRPAGSVNTAFQLVAVIFQLQSLQQFGGVSATHLDWTMVPYVRKSFWKHYKNGLEYLPHDSIINATGLLKETNFDNFVNGDQSIDHPLYKYFENVYNYAMEQTIKETRQAAEGLYHNLNTLQSRSGNQLPFTSINYGTCTLPEGRMVIDALLDVSIEGLGRLRKTSVFPCGIFQSMRGVNQRPGDPNYDLFQKALRSTAQRLYPNYANVDWSGNAGYDRNRPETYFSTMGKRKLSSCKIF
jgi:ribonucleoside-triphosphate reductase